MDIKNDDNGRSFPSYWEDWFDERAAILEYDAGLSREDAEVRAMEMAMAEMLRRGEPG